MSFLSGFNPFSAAFNNGLGILGLGPQNDPIADAATVKTLVTTPAPTGPSAAELAAEARKKKLAEAKKRKGRSASILTGTGLGSEPAYLNRPAARAATLLGQAA